MEQYDHIEEIYERKFQNRKDILVKFKDRYILKQIQKESPSHNVEGYVRFQDVSDEYIQDKKYSVAKNPRNPIERELVSCENCHNIVDGFFDKNCDICGGNLKLWKPKYSIPRELFIQFNNEAEQTYSSLQYMESMFEKSDRTVATIEAEDQLTEMR